MSWFQVAGEKYLKPIRLALKLRPSSVLRSWGETSYLRMFCHLHIPIRNLPGKGSCWRTYTYQKHTILHVNTDVFKFQMTTFLSRQFLFLCIVILNILEGVLIHQNDIILKMVTLRLHSRQKSVCFVEKNMP